MENRWTVWLLLAVAALQVYTLMRVGELRREVSAVESRLSQVRNLESRLSNMDHKLATISRANEWMINPRVQVNPDASCGSATVALDWSFREVDPGSPVTLLYRRSGETEWLSVAATSTGEMGYRASFNVQGAVTVEPMIQVHRQAQGGSAARAESTSGRPLAYEYRMVAQVGGSQRSTEIRDVPVGHLFQARLRIEVNVQKNDYYHVRLIQMYKPERELSCLELRQAEVRGYAGGQQVVVQPLAPGAGPDMREAELRPGKALDRMEVVVRLGSGEDKTIPISLAQ